MTDREGTVIHLLYTQMDDCPAVLLIIELSWL